MAGDFTRYWFEEEGAEEGMLDAIGEFEGPLSVDRMSALTSVFRFGSAELGERPCRRSCGCCWMVGMPQAR
ncbi:hypothetical protein, partial [Streptomyces sp. NPDC007117]|uniref:hypothetical protein n=1 Tax=Streptomyces sp. NPDC007117 TaxID=3154314 RepID=UPI00340A7061